MKACNDMGDLIVSIVAAFNTQEVRRLEEVAAREREQAEQEVVVPVVEVADVPVEKPAEKVTTKQVKKVVQDPTDVPASEMSSGISSTDIPGFRIIPTGKSPKK